MHQPGETSTVPHAFDALAEQYDAEFSHTPCGRALRDLVWRRLARAFEPTMRVLELGCGTGEDAQFLARRGVRVVACDPSARMIDMTHRKARQQQCADRIELHCTSMEKLAERLAGQRFDGVYSNFGAVNCVPDIAAVAAGIAPLLKPGAALVWVAMGRHVPWEWLWFAAQGQWRKATRRLRRGAVPWRDLQLTYPTPATLAALINMHFATERTLPLGFALPPSYAAGWLNRSPRAAALFTTIERAAQHFEWPAAWSDHFILEARRRPD